MKFSERQGIRPIKNIIQVDSMDDDLRNRLWNILSAVCWRLPREVDVLSLYPDLSNLVIAIWHRHLKLPTDLIPRNCSNTVSAIRKYYFGSQWYEVYDLIDFVANALPTSTQSSFINGCNHVLKDERSGYRFIAGRLAPITTKEEVTSIERAVSETRPMFPGASEHLRTAIDLLAKKPRPDYRNSIKESISAVEALCVAITGDEKATLRQALKAIDPQAELHGALRGAFEKLYGYTSDADGIRHALLEEDHLEQEDAVFMLVACSAFVSYVIAKKARKA